MSDGSDRVWEAGYMHADDAQRQEDDRVRPDLGGWISGPCLDQPLNAPHGMTDAEASALWGLRNSWGTYYGVSFSGDEWRAHRLGTGAHFAITADTSEELSGLIWADYQAWRAESRPQL